MLVARPENNEPDLLKGHEFEDLYLYDLEGILIVRQNPPEEGWNHDSLEMVTDGIVTADEHPTLKQKGNPLEYGWDAYLGDKSKDGWIGSSEV